MELVGNFRFLGEYGELETVKIGDREEASEVSAVGASVGRGFRLCPYWPHFSCSLEKMAWWDVFCPDGGIWASGTMVEAAAVAAL